MSSADSLICDDQLPYCRGCGHTPIARAIAGALEATGLAPDRLCMVSDIGCVGLIDRLFPKIHTVHATHGRSTAFATGISVADGVLADGALKTVVVIGDGGATIGLLHLVAAAQLNVDLTVVLHNNGIYGMTGGQSSGLTPQGWITATTRSGNPLPPIDVLSLLRSAGATFLARDVATSGELVQTLHSAIDHPGFAVVEVLELCLPFAVRHNKVSGAALAKLAEPTGVQHRDTERPAFRQVLTEANALSEPPPARKTARPVEHGLTAPYRFVLAGTAGERVQSVAGLAARLAVASGLFATRKNDNLVSQGTGFSTSEVVLSPQEIHYTGSPNPDAVVVASADGLARVMASGVIGRTSGLVVVDDSLEGVPEVAGRLVRLPLRRVAGRNGAALAGLVWTLNQAGVFSLSALRPQLVEIYGERLAGKVAGLADRLKAI